MEVEHLSPSRWRGSAASAAVPDVARARALLPHGGRECAEGLHTFVLIRSKIPSVCRSGCSIPGRDINYKNLDCSSRMNLASLHIDLLCIVCIQLFYDTIQDLESCGQSISPNLFCSTHQLVSDF
ncbi:hypothetical protein DAI22_02g063700 [Oryza sativa Japonica Group]|nr:hypothetical protein DAI22_02g063700 [Oryza sativa Japonica Group]